MVMNSYHKKQNEFGIGSIAFDRGYKQQYMGKLG